jgi:P27 family predicted phage terminase small subunit
MKTPEELQGDALLAWHQYIAELAELGPVTKLDRAALITLCRATAMKEDAAANVEKTGTVIKLPNGYPGPSPYLKVFFESAKLEKSLLIEMGLTRASRSKVKKPQEQAATDLDF